MNNAINEQKDIKVNESQPGCFIFVSFVVFEFIFFFAIILKQKRKKNLIQIENVFPNSSC